MSGAPRPRRRRTAARSCPDPPLAGARVGLRHEVSMIRSLMDPFSQDVTGYLVHGRGGPGGCRQVMFTAATATRRENRSQNGRVNGLGTMLTRRRSRIDGVAHAGPAD